MLEEEKISGIDTKVAWFEMDDEEQSIDEIKDGGVEGVAEANEKISIPRKLKI